MALEARHHNHFSQQIIPNNRQYMEIDQAKLNNHVQMGCANPFATTMGNPWLGLNHQYLGLNNMMIQPQTNSIKAESGLSNNLPNGPRKRSRDSIENQFNNLNLPQSPNNVPLQGFASQNCTNDLQHLLETDFILSQFRKKIKSEVAARQKQDAKYVLASVTSQFIYKMKEKDEQILNMGKLNMALQERAKNLYIENQLWKDIANTSGATAMSLRQDLEIVLAQVSKLQMQTNAAAAEEQEAESFCGSNDSVRNKQEVGQGRTLVATADDGGDAAGTAVVSGGNRMCKKCGERESCVLLLPCRHLCLCGGCGATLQVTCPVCNSLMNATVHISLT